MMMRFVFFFRLVDGLIVLISHSRCLSIYPSIHLVVYPSVRLHPHVEDEKVCMQGENAWRIFGWVWVSRGMDLVAMINIV